MGKYAPLSAFLVEQGRDCVPMSFSEIERLLGLSLPPSKRYPAWWSNNPSNNPMTKEWLRAGYQTESVDVVGQKLIFKRVKHLQPTQNDALSRQESGTPRGPKESRHPGFGFMKGLLIIEDGYDVTQPLDEVWDQGYLGLEERK